MKSLAISNGFLRALVTVGVLTISACSAPGPGGSHQLPPTPPPVEQSAQSDTLDLSPSISGRSISGWPATVYRTGGNFTPNGEVFCGLYGQSGSGVGWLGYSNLFADGSGNFSTQFGACSVGQGSLWGYDYTTNTYSNSLGVYATCLH